jgi:hypothetical protein
MNESVEKWLAVLILVAGLGFIIALSTPTWAIG